VADTSLLFTVAGRERVSGILRNVRDSLDRTGKAASKALTSFGVGLAPASALGATMLATASSVASAGMAVGAFKAAVQPQLNSVTEAAELYATAQEAVAKGGEDAAAAQQAYADALAEMEPATRDTAVAFVGLKEDFTDWSNSLSGTTMPIFTRGIEVLRDLLPSLTPFVQAASSALGNMMDKIEAGAKSEGFANWLSDFATTAGPTLDSLLTTMGNLAVGAGALLQAFLPMNSGMSDLTGSLEAGSEAFRDWATGLEGSEGFAEFIDNAKMGGEALGNVAEAALNVFVALAPMLGTTVMLANAFALVVANVPTPVLTALGVVITSIMIGLRLYALYQSIVTTATLIATGVQAAYNAVLAANPYVLIVLAIIALIAVIVLIAKKTTWFQDIWRAMTRGIRAAWDWCVEMVKKGFNFIKNLFMNFTGPGLFIRHFDKIKSTVSGAMSTIKDRIKWGIDKAKEIIGALKDMPGKVVDWFSGLGSKIGNTLKDGFKSGINAIIDGWNNLSFTIPGVSLPGPLPDFGGATISTPNVPRLYSGGTAAEGGVVSVGERGREEMYMPKGASVRPLTRGGGEAVIRLQVEAMGDDEFKRRVRRTLRINGRGVQVEFI
jgi:phage-related protein